jgi:hypothetical protein
MSFREKLRLRALYFVAFITSLDLIGTVLVRVLAEQTPVVAGDVSKVGIGILAGALMTPGRPPSVGERSEDRSTK